MHWQMRPFKKSLVLQRAKKEKSYKKTCETVFSVFLVLQMIECVNQQLFFSETFQGACKTLHWLFAFCTQILEVSKDSFVFDTSVKNKVLDKTECCGPKMRVFSIFRMETPSTFCYKLHSGNKQTIGLFLNREHQNSQNIYNSVEEMFYPFRTLERREIYKHKYINY